jgi:hypothetical protein
MKLNAQHHWLHISHQILVRRSRISRRPSFSGDISSLRCYTWNRDDTRSMSGNKRGQEAVSVVLRTWHRFWKRGRRKGCQWESLGLHETPLKAKHDLQRTRGFRSSHHPICSFFILELRCLLFRVNSWTKIGFPSTSTSKLFLRNENWRNRWRKDKRLHRLNQFQCLIKKWKKMKKRIILKWNLCLRSWFSFRLKWHFLQARKICMGRCCFEFMSDVNDLSIKLPMNVLTIQTMCVVCITLGLN